MIDRFTQIGFDRQILLEWLEYTVNLVLAGNSRQGVYAALDEFLSDKLAVGSTAKRNARDKTITILMRIWFDGMPELESLRARGLEIIRQLPIEEHVPIHWGMSMAEYPFLKSVASNVGRLLRLQESVTSSQIQRRVREKYGERETVSRATQRVMYSFVDWGVLEKEGKTTIYRPGIIRHIDDPKLIAWLSEALLHANPDSRSLLNDLLQSPALFPFTLKWVPPNVIEELAHVQVAHQGLDGDLLILRKN